MVDFNSETTVSTPPGELLKILILQRREYVIDALEQYYSQESRGGTGRDNVVHAGLRSLFLELQAALKRDLPPETYKDLRTQVFSGDVGKAENAFEYISTWLDTKRITRVDTRRHTDPEDIEGENVAEGL